MQVIEASYEIMNPYSEYMTNEQFFQCQMGSALIKQILSAGADFGNTDSLKNIIISQKTLIGNFCVVVLGADLCDLDPFHHSFLQSN